MQLVAAIDKGQMCLVLGAGASQDAGMPGWGALTREMAAGIGQFRSVKVDPSYTWVSTEAAREHMLFRTLIADGSDLPWILEMLCDALGGKHKAHQYLREKLYAPHDAMYPAEGKTSGAWTVNAAFADRALRFLAALSILVAAHSLGRQFHVITYNVDTLLEEAISVLGHKAVALCPGGREYEREEWDGTANPLAYSVGPRQRRYEVTVLHPHGLIPRVGESGRMVRYPVMFASEYDRAPASDIVARVQEAAAFSSLTCLFYGWSFQDYLVRRVIRLGSDLVSTRDYAHRTVHWALMRRRSIEDGPVAAREVHPGILELDRLERGALKDKLMIEVLSTRSFDQQKSFLARVLRECRWSGLLVPSPGFDWLGYRR